jgi:hypothetical protein
MRPRPGHYLERAKDVANIKMQYPVGYTGISIFQKFNPIQ